MGWLYFARAILHILRRVIRLLWRIVRYVVFVIVFALLIQRSGYYPGAVDEYRFDYIVWEVEAIASKVGQTLWGVHPFIDSEDGSQYVREYMADLELVYSLEQEIAQIFTDPDIVNPSEVTADLRAERDALRIDLGRRQVLVEGILEGQVAAVLVDEGFGFAGQLLPPISMHFTRIPNLLVTSPRDRIMRQDEIAIVPMPLEQIVELEQRIEQEQDVATLVVPLGGMALYPAMIRETTNILWAVETFAHEWVHHYLFFFPLGLNYFTTTDNANREAMIINETVADIFGAEIAELVLRRYYPEFVPETQDNSANSSQMVSYVPENQSDFDYGTEMNLTRVNVDNIMSSIQMINEHADLLRSYGHDEKADSYEQLAQYYVLKAEDYMEERRVLFYENGYRIRKMNQAYFAFYGGYQGGIPGIGGEDPIGPAVRDIHAASRNSHSFIKTMRGITSRDELLRVIGDLD